MLFLASENCKWRRENIFFALVMCARFFTKIYVVLCDDDDDDVRQASKAVREGEREVGLIMHGKANHAKMYFQQAHSCIFNSSFE